MKRWLLSGLLVLLTLGVRAQEPRFAAETRTVLVPVTVIDAAGRNVDGLTAGDFQLTDDGVEQRITLDFAATGVAPISLAVVIQASGVSAAALLKTRRLGSLIPPQVTGERGAAAVIAFDDQVRWIQDFTSDSDALQKAFGAVHSGSDLQGKMLDAVVEAADRMKERKGRKIILLISETRDRGSAVTLSKAMEAMARDDIQVFAATYSAYTTPFTVKSRDLPPPSDPNFIAVFTELARLGKTNDVKALVESTGGAQYRFTRQRALEQAIGTLGADVHSQYLLAFTPTVARAGMHRIHVEILHHGSVKSSFRNAYWAE